MVADEGGVKDAAICMSGTQPTWKKASTTKAGFNMTDPVAMERN